MATYFYRYADTSGAIREAVREAPSEEVLLRDLSAGQLYPIDIRVVEPGIRSGPSAARGARYSMRAVRDFTSGISLMVRAGLSVRDALEVARLVFPSRSGKRGEVRRLVDFLDERLRGGASLSTCISSLGSTFPPVYRGLVRIGEKVGTLDQVLDRLALYLEDQKKMRDKVLGALTYPLLVLGVAFGGMILVAAVVVPKAKDLFSQVGTGLPAGVRGIESSATLVLAVAIGLIAAAVAGALVLRILRARGGEPAAAIDAAALRTPGVGRFLSVREMVNLSFALEVLTESGVPVEEALREAAHAVGNRAIAAVLARAADDVVAGRPVSKALEARYRGQVVIPERVAHWVVIGERTGHVERVFSQLRIFYQAELEKWTSRIMTLVEPALIVAVGIVLLVMILTFVVPLFSLYGSIVPQ